MCERPGPGGAVRLAFALLAGCALSCRAMDAPGWGVDAWLAGHATPSEFAGYLKLLKASGVRVVRERGLGGYRGDGTFGAQDQILALRDAGLRVVCFASLPKHVPVERAGDVLPENLLGVFASGEALGRDSAGLVDAWEMIGEPDVGYCRDLPDRLAAFQKALYLGILAGSREAWPESPSHGSGAPGPEGAVGPADTPFVVMGALALPPGPWLRRAARNGLLDYTDAYNFHYYGRAGDFDGFVAAHRAAAGPELPLWITECGANTVRPDDFLNPDRRRMQAEFVVSTARRALEDGVALFMPFILFERGDPYALTLSPDRPLPAWTGYSELTRSTPWPDVPWARRAPHPDPVVLQWLPDPGATVPHKVSGTYRFRDGAPMRGELRVYNLGPRPVRGRLKVNALQGVTCSLPIECNLAVDAGTVRTLPVVFSPSAPGYFQAWFQAEFAGDDGSRSPLYFGLERTPRDEDFKETKLQMKAVGPAERQRSRAPDFAGASSGLRGTPGHPPSPQFQAVFPGFSVTSSAGPWLGLNGIRVETLSDGAFRFTLAAKPGEPVGDPLRPPMAVARIDGLPADGFLRVRTDPVVGAGSEVRVDLVDEQGQRFAIWENCGQSYTDPTRDLWLNLRDFGPFFWGRFAADPRFRPGAIREIQLRFFLSGPGRSLTAAFAVMTR